MELLGLIIVTLKFWGPVKLSYNSYITLHHTSNGLDFTLPIISGIIICMFISVTIVGMMSNINVLFVIISILVNTSDADEESFPFLTLQGTSTNLQRNSLQQVFKKISENLFHLCVFTPNILNTFTYLVLETLNQACMYSLLHFFFWWKRKV